MWLRKRHAAPDAVAAYWSALVRDASSEELARLAAPLESDFPATMARIREMGDHPLPEPAFVARLEHDLMESFAKDPARSEAVGSWSRNDPVIGPNQTRRPIATRVTAALRSQPLPRTAATLLVIAALVAAALVGHGLYDDNDGGNNGALIAAPTAVPAATPTISTDSLFQTIFPQEARPTGGAKGWLSRVTFAPGVTLTDPGWRTGSRASFEYVVSGSVTAVSPALGWVIRAGAAGDATPTAAGDQVTLNAGDTLVLLPPTISEASRPEIRSNPGTENAVVLTGGVTAEIDGAVPKTPGVTIEDLGLLTSDEWKLPSGSIGVKLQRITLPPGAKLALPLHGKVVPGGLGASDKIVELRAQQWIVGKVMDDSATISSADALAILPDSRGDTLRNDGSTPVVVYIVIFASTSYEGV